MNYRIEVSPAAQKIIPTLPGHVRQRVRRAISDLAQEPRPPRSKELDFPLDFGEPRRLRLANWRIIYTVIETDVKVVAVVGVHKRPPYNYDDLSELFSNIFR